MMSELKMDSTISFFKMLFKSSKTRLQLSMKFSQKLEAMQGDTTSPSLVKTWASALLQSILIQFSAYYRATMTLKLSAKSRREIRRSKSSI